MEDSRRVVLEEGNRGEKGKGKGFRERNISVSMT